MVPSTRRMLSRAACSRHAALGSTPAVPECASLVSAWISSLIARLPLKPSAISGPTVHGKAAALPEATVGAEQVGVLLDDRVEMRAGDLLFALDDPADRQRQPVAGLAHGADGCQPDADLGLVVGRAAREEPVAPERRLEWRGIPELDRIDGLDVTVVVEEQRGVALAGKLAVDRGRCPVDSELPGLEVGAGQQGFDELRGLAERPLLGGDARLPAQLPGQIERLLLDRPHVVG